MEIMTYINQIIRSVLFKVGMKNNSAFTFDIKKVKQYVKSFPTPKDDIERSFYQYKCQMKLNGNFRKICLNFVSVPVLILCLLQCRKTKKSVESTKNAVFFPDGKPNNILPEEVRKNFEKVIYLSRSDTKKSLEKKDIKFILGIWKRHPLSWLYVSKIAFKISEYRYVINTYNPTAIIVCNEYSFTSSALTKFCNDNKIEHIDVMHGEKYYDMRDSFFRYNRCYVWDKYYEKLFIKLRADKNQFIVAIPESLIFKQMDISKTHDYTYYLADENYKTLAVIANELQILSKNNQVYIRPHPRYSNKEKVAKIFKNFEIEDCFKVSIEESILSTKYAISLSSSALNQAEHNGTIVIIDDISDGRRYKKLFELEYIGVRKPHLLLSHILSEQEGK